MNSNLDNNKDGSQMSPGEEYESNRALKVLQDA